MIAYDGANSCFIDTAIMSLFNVNQKWLLKNILKRNPKVHEALKPLTRDIQKELTHLYIKLKNSNNAYANGESRSSGGSCNDLRHLRKLFHEYDIDYQKAYPERRFEKLEWRKTQLEPNDVYKFFLRIFDIKEDVKVKVNSSLRKYSFNSPYIPASDLINKKNVYLDTYFPVTRDVTTITYRYVNVLCVNIERNYLNTKVITPIKFKDHMICGKTLWLKSIIIHNGGRVNSGHYMAYLKKKDGWYFYNDIGPVFKKVGKAGNNWWNNSSVEKNCTQLIYSFED